MTPKIKSVQTTNEYELIIEYIDGIVKKMDFKKMFDKNMFLSLKDNEIFKTAHIAFDTVEWNNGIDIDPDDLFEESVEVIISKIA